jgi:hypothetical protein
MLLSSESPFAGAFAVPIPGAMLLHRSGLVYAVPPESMEHVQTDNRVPQELGRSCRLLGKRPGGSYRVNNSRPQRGTRPLRNELSECHRGTAKRRQRSAAGGTAGSHSVLIVPMKLANGSRPEPVEGSETSDHGTAFGKHDECLEIR